MIGYKWVYFFSAKAFVFALLFLALFDGQSPVLFIAIALGIVGGLAGVVARTLKAQEERIKQLEQSIAEQRTRID